MNLSKHAVHNGHTSFGMLCYDRTSMVYVSKRAMQKQVLEHIITELLRFIERSSVERNVSVVVLELLTESERIQLAKRLAILMLLAKGVSSASIERTLCVSRTTVQDYTQRFHEGAFDELSHLLAHKRSMNELERILKGLEIILSPSRRRSKLAQIVEIL
jgi:Trp operon repressor